MIENIAMIIFSIIMSMMVVFKPIKEIIIKRENVKKYKYELMLFVIILIGCLIRCVGLSDFPRGLNPDETSSAYEAWAISNYGIDRNGNEFPVFLVSWGSGQNALYTYLLIPFIKLLGLTEFATRLPMAIISCTSLIVIYCLFKEVYNKKMGVIAAAFLAICPWHIMKSRYGLESNIFPDIILLSTLFIALYIQRKKLKYIYIAFAILGISAYTYGTSYFFLPFFAIPLLIYLIYKKKINLKNTLIALVILTIIAMPIIIMVIINTFDLPEVKLFGVFSIPRCKSNRYEEMTSVFSKDFLQNSIKNVVSSCKLLLYQHDYEFWHAMPIFGIFYIFSIPFTIYGIIKSFSKKEKDKNAIINFWFGAALLMLFVVKPNVVRINIIWIPLVMYTIIGIYDFINKSLKKHIFVIAIYLFGFCAFITKYFNTSFGYPMFINNAKEVIKYLENKNQKIYMEYSFKEPYIYVMFYNKMEPEAFADTAQFFNKNGVFANVKAIKNYNFYLPERIENTENYIYVINKNNNLNIDYNKFNVQEIKNFLILEYKEN